MSRANRSFSGFVSRPCAVEIQPSQVQIIQDKRIQEMEKKLVEDFIKTAQAKPYQACPMDTIAQNTSQEVKGKLTQLRDMNAEYFDHIAGRCVCARCTCGRHKCNQRSLVEEQHALPDTLYNNSYQGKKGGIREKAIHHQNNITIKKELHLENHTTHRDNYTPKQAKREISLKRHDNILTSIMPGQMLADTAYTATYNNKPYSKPAPILPVPTIGVVQNSPFIGTSEMQSQFNPDKLKMFAPNRKEDIISKSVGVNMGVDQSKTPNFYKSTYMQGYSPMKASPEERNIINNLKKINQSLHTFYGDPQFFPATTKQNSYQDKTKQVCPIIIERTRGLSAYQPFSELPKSNSSFIM